MKTLVVFYSLTGNCRAVADVIVSEIGADKAELKTKKEPPGEGFKKFVWGGLQVISRKKPELQPLKADLSAYELVVLGAPVWVGTFAPALKTFLSLYAEKLKGKKVALFTCSGSPNNKALLEMRKELSASKVSGMINFCEPRKVINDQQPLKSRVSNWLKEAAK